MAILSNRRLQKSSFVRFRKLIFKSLGLKKVTLQMVSSQSCLLVGDSFTTKTSFKFDFTRNSDCLERNQELRRGIGSWGSSSTNL